MCLLFKVPSLTFHPHLFIAAAFYTVVFGWQSAPSHLGIPAEKILTFTVPGGVMPIGGAFRRVEAADTATAKGTSKLYFYVDDIAAAIEASFPSQFTNELYNQV